MLVEEGLAREESIKIVAIRKTTTRTRIKRLAALRKCM